MLTIDSAILRFRARQAAQFSQRATILRPTGEPVFDEETGVVQPTLTVGVDVPCKTTAENRQQGRDEDAGETEVRLADMVIKFPVDTDVEVHDLVEITASTYNPLDVGRSYRITDVDRREWQIARRCIIEEVLVPALHEEGV